MRLPYPGLRPFQRDESDLFFGREGCVDEMVRRLAATRLLAVLGTSGSGKSSLVMTGLLDALELGLHARAGSRWRIAYLRPGGRPTENLAWALLNAGEPTVPPGDADVEMLATFLKRGPRSVTEWCRDGNLPSGTNLLILVDQFEELFRYSDYAGREESEAFVALLLESSWDPDAGVNVTITMRSEYLGTCALIPGLAERINAGLYLVPRMSREEVRSAIEGPAAVCGFSIEPALVNRLLNDLATLAPWEDDRDGDQLQRLSRRADQLPLMQHVLNRIWLRAAETAGGAQVRLLLDDYNNLGGLTGALDAHAGEVFNGIPAADRPVVETVFRALISGTSVANAVRLPSRFDTLVTIADGNHAAVARVVEAFRASGCNFLMPPPSTPLEDETIIDISHESLIRQWSLLRNWVRTEFQSAETYRHIGTSAALWKEHRSGLLSMPYLGVALTWQREQRPNAAWAERRYRGGDLTLAMDFLDTSGRRYRQRRLRTRATAAVGVMALVVALAAFAYIQTQKAKDREEALLQVQNNLSQVQQELATVTAILKNTSAVAKAESEDFHIPPQDALQSDVGTPTPTTIPGGTTLATEKLAALVKSQPAPLLVDALNDYHVYTIPDALWLPFAGQSGNFSDDIQRRLKIRLDNLTNGNLDQPLVFFCAGVKCWESYNAALRAIHAGYRHVYWYRGGLAVWGQAGFHTENIFRQTTELQDRLTVSKIVASMSGAAAMSPRQRWAWALSLTEIAEALAGSSQLGISYFDSAITAENFSRDEVSALLVEFPDNADIRADLALTNLRMATSYEKLAKAELADTFFQYAGEVDKQLASDSYKNAETVLRSLADLASTHPNEPALLSTIAADDVEIGDQFERDGHAQEAAEGYAAAATIDEALAAKDSKMRANLWRDLINAGNALADQKKYDEALADSRDALTVAKAEAADDAQNPTWQLEISTSERVIGLTLRNQGALDDAEAALRNAIAVAKAVLDKYPTSSDASYDVLSAAQDIGGLAYSYVLVKQFTKALDTSNFAIGLAPNEIWIQGNRAHALMFLGQTDAARAIYLKYRGQKVGDVTWEDEVKGDFADLRKHGLSNPLMDEIEKDFTAPVAKNAAGGKGT